MKSIVKTVAGFNPLNRQINLSNIAGFDLSNLYAIINVTKSTPIYIVGKSGCGLSALQGTTLTLQCDTTGQQATDKLMVIYETDYDFAKDSTLAQLGVLLTSINTKDFASSLKQDALFDRMGEILAELRDDKQITESVWQDKVSEAYFVRRVTVNQDSGAITVSFVDVAGNNANPTVANLIQVNSQADNEIFLTGFRAIGAGTGFVAGERIVEIQIVNTKDSSITATIWKNATTNTVLGTVPSLANLQGESEKVFADMLTRLTEIRDKIQTLTGGTPVTTNGTIATGGTAQQVLAANANRKIFSIRNVSSSNLFYRFDGVAGNNAGRILRPEESWENPAHYIPTSALSVWGAVSGQQFIVTEG